MKKILLVIIILVAGIWLVRHLPSKNGSVVITDFSACQKAGRPVIDTYPRTCQGVNDKTYTEVVDEKDLNTDPVIFSPDLSRPVTSPLSIQGEARGFWFFERQFKVRLLDDKGQEIATGTAKTKSPALTVEFITFNITLTFKKPGAKMGFLVLEKANPTGLASQSRQVQLPILFQAPTVDKTSDSKEPVSSSTDIVSSSSPKTR
ncbi:MAG: Gmad2 immunoglobulin-like domain-containing protein [Patescibacteria group bacterium]